MKKAGLCVCLFLLSAGCLYPVHAQELKFDETNARAYGLALALKTSEALELIPAPRTAADHYVVSFAQVMELLLTEDYEKFSEYEDWFHELTQKKIKSSEREYQFLRAETHLQWAFVYLKAGNEFDAASNLRQAYLIARDCRRESKNFLAIRKTYGLLQVIIGSVPEKYNWVLSLLGMEGSIAGGLDDLGAVAESDSPFAFESKLLLSLTQGFILQKPDSALASLNKIITTQPENRLALYLASALAIKNSQSEEALVFLTALDNRREGLPIHYADYLRGEVFLHKAHYLPAIASYRSFINHYKGQNYLKDAHYKIGLCYWLNGSSNDALTMFAEARKVGKESSEADRSAAASLSRKELPHVLLSKIRFATDGGYYDKARVLLDSLSGSGVPARRHQVEYFYRKARLEHKTNRLEAAKLFYEQTIDLAGDENWYFAPNACLQLGYIAVAENRSTDARNYFTRALSYKKHEYKNSIDSKARSALGRLAR